MPSCRVRSASAISASQTTTSPGSCAAGSGRWTSRRHASCRGLDGVLQQLWDHLPAQTLTSLVHGDFRLDNCLVGRDSSVRAVLDWELCTVGEPLADVGLLMVYWAEPGDELRATADSPTAVPGFPSRSAMLERYAQTRGRSLPAIDFYIAFSYWRLACITEGVLARYLKGEMGNQACAVRWLFRPRNYAGRSG